MALFDANESGLAQLRRAVGIVGTQTDVGTLGDFLEDIPNGVLAGVGLEESGESVSGGSAEVGVVDGALYGVSDKPE